MKISNPKQEHETEFCDACEAGICPHLKRLPIILWEDFTKTVIESKKTWLIVFCNRELDI